MDLRRLSDEVLFPAALAVDALDRVPEAHFHRLRELGLYGFDGDLRTVEVLAAGCLATTFVWLQHHGARAAAEQLPHLHAWASRLRSGELRAGVARAGARPGAEALTVVSTSDGFILNGSVPWVTGWGMIDIFEVAAIEGDDVVFLFADAIERSTLSAELNRLVAVQASRTVTLTFRNHKIPKDRLVRREPLNAWHASEASGSRLNGGLALGVASRCLSLAGRPTDELDACRQALLDADDASLPHAKAAAMELAMRSAVTLTVRTGSRAVRCDDHAQRLVREAAFLLVFGTRAAIRGALLAGLEKYSTVETQHLT